MTTHLNRETDDPFDRFYTPPAPIRVLLDSPEWPDPDRVAEPCAGMGHIVDVLEAHGCQVRAGDIDPESPCPYTDARDPVEVRGVYSGANAVVTNPPYSAEHGTAAEIIDTLLSLGVWTAALCRITWQEPCQDRGHLLQCCTATIQLPRFEYETPGDNDNETSGNPAASTWFIWDPDADPSEPTRGYTVTQREFDEYRGQETLLKERHAEQMREDFEDGLEMPVDSGREALDRADDVLDLWFGTEDP